MYLTNLIGLNLEVEKQRGKIEVRVVREFSTTGIIHNFVSTIFPRYTISYGNKYSDCGCRRYGLPFGGASQF